MVGIRGARPDLPRHVAVPRARRAPWSHLMPPGRALCRGGACSNPNALWAGSRARASGGGSVGSPRSARIAIRAERSCTSLTIGRRPPQGQARTSDRRALLPRQGDKYVPARPRALGRAPNVANLLRWMLRPDPQPPGEIRDKIASLPSNLTKTSDCGPCGFRAARGGPFPTGTSACARRARTTKGARRRACPGALR
jgi:hypothetical protein